MHQVVVSIGSNVDRRQHIQKAVSALVEQFRDLSCSSVYQSPAVGFDGPDFYNLVCEFRTRDSSEFVRGALKAIEHEGGRKRGEERFSSRTIDLDVLLFGDEILHAQGIDIPRAEILEQAHVLKPLAELLPAQRHPVTNRTFSELWRTFAQAIDTEPRRIEWSPLGAGTE